MSDVINQNSKDIVPVFIEDEMKKSYLDYAMSVIVSRALPDVRDGLKPVHRRILYSMYENGYEAGKPYRKSARIVGDVIGKYHPHGDQAVYDALVRMAQDFSMRLPLIDGQGNFGSLDGDPPAAMRYTEVKLMKVAGFLLDDLDRDTVDFQPNYDNQEKEPLVVPAKFPNLLVNGSGGIAVGMATNIPPHNLGEVINGTLALIDNPELDLNELFEIIPAPDFPTGAYILGYGGARQAFATGRGSVLMRGVTHQEKIGNRDAIIITEIPYQVNKASLVEKIAELVNEKRIEGISDLRDESDRQGVRVVIELKRDAAFDVILNQLYRFTPLQSSFGVNMLALNAGRPEQMGLIEILKAFIEFREIVVVRRIKFELRKARDRAHILVGLAVAVANLDEVVRLIRAASDPTTAKKQLIERVWDAQDMASYIRLIDDPRHPIDEQGRYTLSEKQAQAILDLRLHRLTALGRDEVGNELQGLSTNIKRFLEILASRDEIMSIIKTELTDIKNAFATPRRSKILEIEGDVDDESLIKSEDMVVLVTNNGYIMRVPIDTYRSQKRGGKGRSGMNTRDEDILAKVFIANTLTPVLFFSNTGMVYKLKVYKLPVGTPQSRGKAMVNLLPLEKDEVITTVMPIDVDEEHWDDLQIMFATSNGQARRNQLSDFVNVRANGKIAMKLDEGEKLISVQICSENQDCMLTTHNGRSVRFSLDQCRITKSRDSMGVRGVRLLDDDFVVSMLILDSVDITTEESYAYIRQANQLRRTENSETVDNTIIEDETSEDEDVSNIITLSDERFKELQEKEKFILFITESGFGKRTSSHAFRTMGRGVQGVSSIKLGKKGKGGVAASYVVTPQDDIIAITDGGQIIRFNADEVSIQGRTASGVTLFRTDCNEKIVSVALINEQTEPEEE